MFPRLAFLAQAEWLDGPRLRRIALVGGLVVLAALAVDVWLHTRAGVTAPDGEQLGRDFVNYWAGGHLAAQGRAGQAYDIKGFLAFERAHTAANANFKWFAYPPTTLLLCLPLAAFGFFAAYVAWLAAGTLACFVLLRRTLDARLALLASFAPPAAFMNAISGQNGQFSAALLAGGVLLLEQNPLLAGGLFGAMVFKPHLALLVPVALAAGGYWRAFAAAAGTALVCILLSILLFGPGIWSDFAHNAPINARLMEYGVNFWHRMPTVFSAARLAGLTTSAAYGLQIVSCVGAAILVAWIWRRATVPALRGAALIVAVFLATPYAWDYDMISLTFAAAWLAAEGQRQGFLSWEKTALALLLAMPLLVSPLASHTPFQMGPWILWAMLLLIARRAVISHRQPQGIPLRPDCIAPAV
jgi:hypothetical protein